MFLDPLNKSTMPQARPPSRPNLPPVAHAGVAILLLVLRIGEAIDAVMTRWIARRRLRARIVLSEGALVSIRVPRAIRAVCLRGTVWITRGGADDRIIRGREQWRCVGRSRVVIQAMERTELVLGID